MPSVLLTYDASG